MSQVVYEKEAEQQRNRIQKLKDQGGDEYDVRKQEEVLQETLMMVPDCQRKLAKAFDELKAILDNEPDLNETEAFHHCFCCFGERQSSVATLPLKRLFLCN